MSTTDEQTKFLSIYLEDHVAGATAGSQRAARLADAEAESEDGPALAKFAADVAEISMRCWNAWTRLASSRVG